jgi:hypothetical protein
MIGKSLPINARKPAMVKKKHSEYKDATDRLSRSTIQQVGWSLLVNHPEKPERAAGREQMPEPEVVLLSN